MFVFYNIIWIICIALLFASFFMLLKKRRARNLMNQPGNYATNNPNFVVDMNGQHNYPPPQSYAPPPPPPTNQYPVPTTSSGLEPPPPSYQDYSKDHRVPHLQ